jgi:hypothetical protein
MFSRGRAAIKPRMAAERPATPSLALRAWLTKAAVSARQPDPEHDRQASDLVFQTEPAQCPLRPWHDRLRHGRRTPSLEPPAGIHFAALHNGLERVAARLKRNPTASKEPFGPPMLFTSAHRGPSIARLVQTTSILDWRDSDPGTSINFWNRISMTDSNFALDAGQS